MGPEAAAVHGSARQLAWVGGDSRPAAAYYCRDFDWQELRDDPGAPAQASSLAACAAPGNVLPASSGQLL